MTRLRVQFWSNECVNESFTDILRQIWSNLPCFTNGALPTRICRPGFTRFFISKCESISKPKSITDNWLRNNDNIINSDLLELWTKNNAVDHTPQSLFLVLQYSTGLSKHSSFCSKVGFFKKIILQIESFFQYLMSGICVYTYTITPLSVGDQRWIFTSPWNQKLLWTIVPVLFYFISIW